MGADIWLGNEQTGSACNAGYHRIQELLYVLHTRGRKRIMGTVLCSLQQEELENRG